MTWLESLKLTYLLKIKQIQNEGRKTEPLERPTDLSNKRSSTGIPASSSAIMTQDRMLK